jgi:hypothetical protein
MRGRPDRIRHAKIADGGLSAANLAFAARALGEAAIADGPAGAARHNAFFCRRARIGRAAFPRPLWSSMWRRDSFAVKSAAQMWRLLG